MDLQWLEEDGVLIVKLSGNLDGGSAPSMIDNLDQKLAEGKNDLIIDFSGVDYISSAGLRVVIKANHLLGPAGKKLILCGLKDYVKEVFDLAGLSKIFDIRADLDAAR